MASGRPMVVVSSKNTPITSFLRETETSLLVTNHSLVEFKSAVLRLSSDKNLRHYLGSNGRKVIERNYTKEYIIKKYMNLIVELTI